MSETWHERRVGLGGKVTETDEPIVYRRGGFFVTEYEGRYLPYVPIQSDYDLEHGVPPHYIRHERNFPTLEGAKGWVDGHFPGSKKKENPPPSFKSVFTGENLDSYVERAKATGLDIFSDIKKAITGEEK